MCQHLRGGHLAPAPLTLRLQFSQPGLYLILHRRIEQVLHVHLPPLNENNQEPVSEYPTGAVPQTTGCGAWLGCCVCSRMCRQSPPVSLLCHLPRREGEAV